MKKAYVLMVSIFLLTLLPTPTRALLRNAGFEQGDFSGWETLGYATVQRNASGGYDAILATGPKSVSIQQLDEFLDGHYHPIYGISGSAMRQTFKVPYGDPWDAAPSLDIRYKFLFGKATSYL